MLLRRLPRLRDPAVQPEQAFAGTFHVNESYEQLQRAYEQAAAGAIPALPPCELYCHSLADSEHPLRRVARGRRPHADAVRAAHAGAAVRRWT